VGDQDFDASIERGTDWDADDDLPEETEDVVEEGDHDGIEELAPEEIPEFSDDKYLILRPGEEFEIAAFLPKPRKLPKAVVMHAGELIFCDRRRRVRARRASSVQSEGGSSEVVERIFMVYIASRSRTPKSRPLMYVIATSVDDRVLAWIDHSPPEWDFDASQVKMVAERCGVAFLIERYRNEPEFEASHPAWVK
jgi:hypothetical protein